MIEYDEELTFPFKRVRTITNPKTFVFFVIFSIAYFCASMYAIMMDDTTKLSPSKEIMNINKVLRDMFTSSSWILLVCLLASKIFIIIWIQLSKQRVGCMIKIGFAMECIFSILKLIGMIIAAGSKESSTSFLSINILLCVLILYVQIYIVAKIKIEFMSKVLEEAIRAILRFPLIVVLSILFQLSIVILVAFGIFVFVCLLSITNFKSPSVFLILCHCLNVCGTLWISGTIFLFNQMLLYRTFSNWYYTANKSKVPNDIITLRSFITSLTYHVGTAAYGSSIWFVFPIIIAMWKNSKNWQRELRHNHFVMIVCWWNVFLKVCDSSAGITGIHGKCFKKSVKTVYQLYLQFPLHTYSITKAYEWFIITTNMGFGLLVAIFLIPSVTFAGTPENSIIIALSLVMSYILLILPFITIIFAAVTSIFVCMLEDLKFSQEDTQRVCFIRPDIKDILMMYN